MTLKDVLCEVQSQEYFSEYFLCKSTLFKPKIANIFDSKSFQLSNNAKTANVVWVPVMEGVGVGLTCGVAMDNRDWMGPKACLSGGGESSI